MEGPPLALRWRFWCWRGVVYGTADILWGLTEWKSMSHDSMLDLTIWCTPSGGTAPLAAPFAAVSGTNMHSGPRYLHGSHGRHRGRAPRAN